MKILKAIVIALGTTALLLSIPFASASHEGTGLELRSNLVEELCGTKDEFLLDLEEKFNEKVAIEAFNPYDGAWVIVVASPKWKTFSVLVVGTNGVTCLIAAAENAVFKSLLVGDPGI